MKTHYAWKTVFGAAALVAGAIQLQPREVTAADHLDAPGSIADDAADIADFYAWPTDDGTIVAIVTFNAGLSPGDPAPWDQDVLYTIHIDNTADATEAFTEPFNNNNDNASDIEINVRFAPSASDPDAWGVQVLDAPGSSGPMVDWVETEMTDGPVTAWAGLADDPFFFDLSGFLATRTNLADGKDPIDLEFTSLNALGGAGYEITGMVNDDFALTNVLAIVVEFDAKTALAGNSDNFLQMWATTARRAR